MTIIDELLKLGYPKEIAFIMCNLLDDSYKYKSNMNIVIKSIHEIRTTKRQYMLLCEKIWILDNRIYTNLCKEYLIIKPKSLIKKIKDAINVICIDSYSFDNFEKTKNDHDIMKEICNFMEYNSRVKF